MDNGIGWFILILLIAWAGNLIYQGYREETAKPLPMKDMGNGVMEPICPQCHARLVSLQRKEQNALASIVSWLLILSGIFAVLFVHWIVGLVITAIGIIVNVSGHTQHTVLTCPACGADAKILG